MYTRKWTRMNYYESVKMFKKYGLLENYTPEQRALHLFPIYKYERNMLLEKQSSEYKQERERIKQDQKLITRLFRKYPDLKYDPISTSQYGQPVDNRNYSIRFIQKQKQFMRNGYDENSAFAKTEELFQDRIQRKLDSLQITEGLAASNRARSFMNYYQQQAEYESRLKVMRMQRDLINYEESVKVLENSMENYDENLEKKQQDEGNLYERVLYNIVNKGTKNPNEPVKEKSDEKIAEEFMEKTKNVFQKYYERASYSDKLNNLKDQEIKNMIRDSPKKMKKRSRSLLIKLEKLGVQLGENGQLDLSQVPYPHIKKQIEANPLVKIALMQNTLDFEFPHKEHMKQKALDLKKQLHSVESELQQAQEDKHEILKQRFQESKNYESQSYNEDEDDHQIQSQARNSEEYNYSEEHSSIISNAKQDKLSEQNNEESLKNNYLNSLNIPIKTSDNTYKLFETYEERMLRVEAKYLKNQIEEIENQQYEEEYSNEQQEGDQQKLQKQSQILNDTINQFRRLKYRMEQQNIKDAKELLFEEHEVFNREDLLIDQEVPYEELEEYLKIPKQEKVNNDDDEVEYMQINELIKTRDIKEDLVHQFSKYYEHKLHDKDSLDSKLQKQQHQKLESQLSGELNKTIQEQEDSFINSSEQVDESQARKKSKKEEKKQLLEFIQKANKKKQVVGKSTKNVAEQRRDKKEGRKLRK